MKTIPVVALLFLSNGKAFPQGQIVFNNQINGTVVAPIFAPDPPNPELARHGNTINGVPQGTQHYAGAPLQGPGFSAQLFGGPTNADPGALPALAQAVTFRIGEGAGFVVPPDFPVTIPGVPEGERAKLQLRAWDNNNGTVTSWEQVQANPGIRRGESLPFLSRPLGRSIILPPNLEGLQSFNLALPAGTAALLPARPDALEAVAVSTKQIDLSWHDAATNELGFQVEQSLDGIAFAPAGTATSNVTTYSAIQLKPGLRHYYRVRAFNSAGHSEFSNTNFVSTRTPFVQWQIGNFPGAQWTNQAIAGPEADPDNDRINNFSEYTFGRSPLSPDLMRPGRVVIDPSSNHLDYLALEYSRNKEAIDAEVGAEVSSNLFAWQSGSNLVTGPLFVSETEEVITEKFRDKLPLQSAPQHFLRLQVTRVGLRDSWETNAPMPLELGDVAAGVIGQRLYMVGGGSSATLAFDIPSGLWTNLQAARPFPGRLHAAEVFNGKLYLFGGLGGGSEGRVQIYEPATNGWSLGPPMPFAAGASASVLINGRIYVAGGIAAATTTNAMARYSPLTGTWTNLALMPQGRSSAAAGTDGNLLYIFGGRSGGDVVANGSDTLQTYNPVSNIWLSSATAGSLLTPLPQSRSGMGRAVFFNGEFFVMGGETLSGPGATAQRVYNRVDIYNSTLKTWRQGTPMLTARHGIYPVLAAGRIYVAGGGVVAGASSSALLEVYLLP